MGPEGAGSIHSSSANILSPHYVLSTRNRCPYLQEAYCSVLKEIHRNAGNHTDIWCFNVRIRFCVGVRDEFIQIGRVIESEERGFSPKSHGKALKDNA